MPTDISNLTTAELDELIAEAAQRRAQMQPAISNQPPQGPVPALLNPRWSLSMGIQGSEFHVLHPGFGWVSMVIPAAERALLASFFLQHALLDPNKPAIPSATPADSVNPMAGGGSLH